MEMLCIIHSCQHSANSAFAFWNFLKKFFKDIFDPRLVEFQDAEPRMKNPRMQSLDCTHSTQHFLNTCCL